MIINTASWTYSQQSHCQKYPPTTNHSSVLKAQQPGVLSSARQKVSRRTSPAREGGLGPVCQRGAEQCLSRADSSLRTAGYAAPRYIIRLMVSVWWARCSGGYRCATWHRVHLAFLPRVNIEILITLYISLHCCIIGLNESTELQLAK